VRGRQPCQRGPYAQERAIGLRSFSLAPLGLNAFEDVAGRGNPYRARAERCQEKRFSMRDIGCQEVGGEARIDPVYAIWRQAHEARRQTANIQDHLAIEAGARAALTFAHAASAENRLSTASADPSPRRGW